MLEQLVSGATVLAERHVAGQLTRILAEDQATALQALLGPKEGTALSILAWARQAAGAPGHKRSGAWWIRLPFWLQDGSHQRVDYVARGQPKSTCRFRTAPGADCPKGRWEMTMVGKRKSLKRRLASHVWSRAMQNRNFGEIADWFTTFYLGIGIACLFVFDVAAGWGWNGNQAVLVAAFGLLIAASAGVAGWVAGLLFGIPRALARPQSVYYTSSLGISPQSAADFGAAGTDSMHQNVGPLPTTRVNTNLEDISDWLTKTIVGVVLTQLFLIPHKLWDFAGSINKAGPAWNGHGQSFVLLLIVYFGVGGFWLGYVGTRTVLTKLFEAVDIPGSDPDDNNSSSEERILEAALENASLDSAIELGEALLRAYPGSGNAGLHVLLARAYGRRYRNESSQDKDVKDLQATRAKVISEVKAAITANRETRDVLYDQWKPSGGSRSGDLGGLPPTDSDLSAWLGP